MNNLWSTRHINKERPAPISEGLVLHGSKKIFSTMGKSVIAFLVLGACVLISNSSADSRLFSKNPNYKWENLKVTFGILNAYNTMPRTTSDKLAQDWTNISGEDCTNGGQFNGFRYISNGEYSLVLLFDVNGYIAGVQMILEKSKILTSDNNFHYDKVPMFQSEILNGVPVFTLTAYFVQPDSICKTGRTAADFSAQGTGTQLYFQNGPTPSDLIIPPKDRETAIAEGWTKNNCFVGMGWHNFYNVEKFEETDCLEVRPVFLLFNKYDQLKAFGFVAFGNADSDRYEKPSATAIKAIVGDTTPQCLIDMANTVTVSSMHVFFDNFPQTELCVRPLW